jgi:hypothetical protein
MSVLAQIDGVKKIDGLITLSSIQDRMVAYCHEEETLLGM